MFGFINKLFKSNSSEPQPDYQSHIILGMVMLNDVTKISFKKIKDELVHKYELLISEENIDERKGISVFQIDRSLVSMMFMNVPIPASELEFPTQISYLWPEAREVVSKHKAHIILSITPESCARDDRLKAYKTFTKLAASVLINTNSLGIYLGNQTLVLPADFYIDGSDSMTDNDLPLLNWIYIGLRNENDKNSGYTFGLKEFGFDELEILNSNYSKEDIHEMLFNLSHFVIQNNVILKSGETIGVTEAQKLKITKSKGVQLDGMTLKIEF